MFDLYILGEGANTVFSLFKHTFAQRTGLRAAFSFATTEWLNIRGARRELDLLVFESQAAWGFTGSAVFGFVLGVETVPDRSDVAHVILLNGGGPFGLQGHRPGMGKWKDDGYRASMHNGIYDSIREIAAQRGWRLYTPRDLAAGVQLPGFGTPALQGGWGPMLGPGGSG